MALDIGFAGYLEIQNLAFKWAECYDTKDWDGLQKIMGPSIRLDFRQVRGPLQENLSIKEYTAVVSDKKVIGDPRVKTQHLLGASSWTYVNEAKVDVVYQIRAAHQRYVAEDMAEVVSKGHGYGFTQLSFGKIDGAWKIVGVRPGLDWSEDNLFGTVNPEGH